MMRTKDIERAERLIEKFFDGETTLAEEKWLYRQFGRSDLPEQLRRYCPMFAAFGSLPSDNERKAQIVSVFRRDVRATAVVLMLLAGITFYSDYHEERMLARLYGGSYVIENGKRIDDLSRIRSNIESTIEDAKRIEAQVNEAEVAKNAKKEVLEGIDDPEMRRQIEEMLNE